VFLAGNLGLGGAERQLYYNIKSLKKQGVLIKLLCLSNNEHYEKKILELGIPVITIGQTKLKILRLLKIVFYVSSFKPNYFQSTHCHTNIYVSVVSKILGLKSIVALRSNYINEVNKPGKFYRKLALRLSDIICTNSKNCIKNALLDGVPRKKIFYLPNVIDTENFKISTKRKINYPVNILCVGRLDTGKRFDKAINLFSKLDNISNDYRARIVGEGPDKDKLMDIAYNRMSLHQNLEFMGQEKDISRFYKWADIFLHTSDIEGTPNVVMEAMSYSLPVIATNVGDTNQLLTHKINGFLFDCNDTKGMLETLKNLIIDYDLRYKIGKSSRENMEKYRSLSTLNNYYKNLYQ